LKEKDIPVQTPSFTKFGFRIRTRVGVVVDNLTIHGRDASEAQRKLRQMYRDCEILECVCVGQTGKGRIASANYEDVLGLLSH
jgi:DNA-nicking Smr family endonuclease